MQISLSLLRHPKDGYVIDLNRLIDLTEIFKVRNTENDDWEFCVYIFEDELGIPRYYGMGRYYDVTKHKTGEWLSSRPFNHRNDLLKATITPDWTCRIVAYGMSSSEAHILEAMLILYANEPLSKRGTKEWDRVSLINKRRERKWEKQVNEYLNLDNGNYPTIVYEN